MGQIFRALRRNQCCLDLGLLASRTTRKKFYLVHSIYGTCYGNSSKLIQAPKPISGKGLVRLKEDFPVEVLSELNQISRAAWVGPGEPFHIK